MGYKVIPKRKYRELLGSIKFSSESLGEDSVQKRFGNSQFEAYYFYIWYDYGRGHEGAQILFLTSW